MARIRAIKPDFWSDYRMARELTRDQRLFYIALWNEADDDGRFLAHPRRLLGAVFPYEDDLTEEWVNASLSRLSTTGRLVLYAVAGEPYGQLIKFAAHQRINRPSPSKIPAPPTGSSESVSAHGRLSEDSLPEGEVEGEVEQGKERDKSNSHGLLNVEKSEHTIYSVAKAAHDVLGMGLWGDELSEKFNDTRQTIMRRWVAGGVSLKSVHDAIHGLRIMVDGGEVEWLVDRKQKPLDGVHVLAKRAVVNGPDGSQMRPLFQLAQEAYARPPAPSRTANTGPAKVSVNPNDYLKAQGSHT